MLTINGIYMDTNVGIGTYTRSLSAALPEAATWRPREMRLGRSRRDYYRKLWDETQMRREAASGLHLHPYPAIALNRKAVLSVLDLIHYRSVNRPVRALIARSIRMASDLLTISQTIADEINAEFGRLAHVVEPLPAPEFFLTPRATAPRSGRTRVAYWGGWHPRKSILPALEALAGTPIELVAIGGVDSLITLRGGLRVRTVSPVSTPELVAIVDGCDLALYPSSEEGYGLPVVEALLRDRPVVVQPLAPYETFLRSSAPGVFRFEPDDPDSLIRAIEMARGAQPGAALQSLAVTDLRLARQRMRDQLLAVPSIRSTLVRGPESSSSP